MIFGITGVADVGITGPDEGKGGKYLILPPGYKGDVPEGYFVVRPSTYGNWMPFRSFLVDGSTKPGVEAAKKYLKIYQLSDAANPPKMKFVNASGVPTTFVPPGDYSFWSLLQEAIQEEPSEGSDPTTLGLFASIGIQKGKPFNPDERMKKILTDAANIGAVTARAIAFRMREKDAYFYPDSPWRLPFFGGYKFEVSPGVANLDGAAFFYYFATGVTPAMAEEMVGKGSQYPWCAQDSDGNPFEGGKTYRLHCLRTSRLKISGQLSSMTTRLDRWFKQISNFRASAVRIKICLSIRTARLMSILAPKLLRARRITGYRRFPVKVGSMILRLYGPLEPWFNKTWKPGGIELVK